MIKRILRFSIFNPNIFGHGGERRTAQISELLACNEKEFYFLPGLCRQEISIRFLKDLSIALFFHIQLIIKLKSAFLLMKMVKNIYHSALIISGTREYTKNRECVLLWEGTKPEYYILPFYFKKLKYHVIGLPHNLESLVPGQISKLTNKKSPLWLQEEIQILKTCDIVFAISREESLLLKQFGIDARYLPYFPCREVYEYFLQIRTKRHVNNVHNKDIRILMIGSVINNPTHAGMLSRIEWFLNAHLGNCKLLIAGYSTEELEKNIPSSSNITIHGTLSNDQLFNLLVDIDVVLIHQVATSGALTRIPEMLIAGVPVILNAESARSFYNVNGVYIYENNSELSTLIIKNEFGIPDLPSVPHSYFNEFIEEVS